MPLIKAKPTSPGRRFVVQVSTPGLHKGEPHAALLAPKSSTGGRNNGGRITSRHRGGGHKQRYRVVDCKRDKDGVPGKVATIEYDPNRTARIALLHYADGEKRYILAPNGVWVGDGGCLLARMLRSSWAMHYPFVRSPSAPSFTTSSSRSARVASWSGVPAAGLS